jgi:hypothetical protein
MRVVVEVHMLHSAGEARVERIGDILPCVRHPFERVQDRTLQALGQPRVIAQQAKRPRSEHHRAARKSGTSASDGVAGRTGVD